ncbi:MAG: major capsid protein [bacterium]|nr:major capsid protein [bacterium]
MERFEELLRQLEEDIASLSVDELTELRTEINAYGLELQDAEVEDETQLLDDVKALAAAMATIDGELESRQAASEEAETARAEAFAAFESEDSEAETEEGTTEEEPETEEPVVAAVPAISDVAARRPRRQPEPPAESDPEVVIAAAVGDDGMGVEFDQESMAHAMFNAFRRGPANGSQTVARMEVNNPYELGAIPEDNWSILQEIQRGAQRARQDTPLLPLSACGFCAPAEPRYTFFQQGSRDGIIDLPTATARRGQVAYPDIVDIRDLMVQEGIGFQSTAQMDCDEVDKVCYEVDCADGKTYAVDAYSTCLLYSNWDQQFWPERVSHITGQAMIANDHEVNLALILAIVGDTRTSTVIDAGLGGGTWVNFVQSLAIHGAYVRNFLRLPLTTILEAGIPSYVLDALVADQVSRSATVDLVLARAEVEAAIRRVGINPQWLYDWQELQSPNWPTDFDYLLWPAGTIVQLNGGSLDMGVTRDSELNKANDFQVFSESWDGIAIIGSGVFVVTGVEMCPTGDAANNADLACADGS